jgi:hypothetical protein
MLGSVIAEIAQKCDFEHASGSGVTKALVVEGTTDELFAGRVLEKDARCFPIRRILVNRGAFIGKGIDLKNINSKDVILDLFQRLSNNPDFFGFPKGCGEWAIYGLIDRDFDDEALAYRRPRLFITDTHDIETLMLSTDEGVLTRIGRVRIAADTVRRALFVSGQMLCFRQALYRLGDKNRSVDIRCLSSADGTVHYAAFTENDLIVPEKMVTHLYKNRGGGLDADKRDSMVRKILADKQLRKHLDKNGKWKYTKETFTPDRIEDFWLQVRGHDILSAVCYCDPEAGNAFRNTAGYGLNREFEKALIGAYNLACFAGTDLYRDMKKAELVVGCSAAEK